MIVGQGSHFSGVTKLNLKYLEIYYGFLQVLE